MIERICLRATSLAVFLLLMAPAIGCRSLVEPDARVERAPDRYFEGSIVEPNGLPVTFMQVRLTNSAYDHRSPTSPHVRTVGVSPTGEFSVPLPPDFDGFFDLEVSYFGSARPSTYVVLGLRDEGKPVRLELPMMRVQGRIEIPSELAGFEFVPYALQLERSERRPAGASGFGRKAYPSIGAGGEFDDIVPGGDWLATIRCNGCGPFERFGARLDADFSGGSLSMVLPLTRFELTPRVPSGWTDPIAVTLVIEGEGADVLELEATLGSDVLEIWGHSQPVYVSVGWPPSVRSQFAVAAPALKSGRVDLRMTQAVDLVLPPHVLRIEVRDGAGPLAEAVIGVERPFRSHRLDTDTAGRAAFFCEKGTYTVEVEHDGRELELFVVVTGDTEIVVDLDAASTTLR